MRDKVGGNPRNIYHVDCPVIPGFQGVNGHTGGDMISPNTYYMFFYLQSELCCIMWSETILLKFRLKDKSSLVSLERDKKFST